MTVKLPELWLKNAADDLKSSKVLLEERIYNIACFHAQQTVEKLFKAFIAPYWVCRQPRTSITAYGGER
jgi:HEPN domain-containing protein